MGKKKKQSTMSLIVDSPQSEVTIHGKEEDNELILLQRLRERVIPKVDDFIKDRDLKNPPMDVIENWYRSTHVGQYLHMERVTDSEGVTYTTKRIQFEFSRMFDRYRENLDDRGVNPSIAKLSFASLKKISFINNIQNPLRYINYFIEYFDDDDELMWAYLNLMHQIMQKDVDFDPVTFIENAHSLLTTDSMIEKVTRMVEYNADASLIKKADRAYDESIQLTVEHLKAIMGVSCLHKMIIPIVSHYYDTKSKLLAEAGMTDKELYYSVLMSYMSAFDDVYDINLHNKLYHTSTTRITKTTNQESGMWDRRKRLGTTPVSYTNDLMRDYVIDISQKAVFAKSAIVFIHVCMDKAIHNTLIQSDKYDYMDLAMEHSDSVNETMSQFDKVMRDMSHYSQLDQFRSRVSSEDAIVRFGAGLGFDFRGFYMPEEYRIPKAVRQEYEHYIQNIYRPMNDTQIYFLKLYFANLVENTADCNSLEFPDIVRVLMIMKRELSAAGYTYFPFFLTGKIDVTAGKKYNKRKIERLVEAHPLYDDLREKFSDAGEYMNWDKTLNDIRTFVACPIRVIDWDHPEIEDKLMTPTELTAVDEVMRFLYRV